MGEERHDAHFPLGEAGTAAQGMIQFVIRQSE